jgi:hypothetical protein
MKFWFLPFDMSGMLSTEKDFPGIFLHYSPPAASNCSKAQGAIRKTNTSPATGSFYSSVQ